MLMTFFQNHLPMTDPVCQIIISMERTLMCSANPLVVIVYINGLKHELRGKIINAMTSSREPDMLMLNIDVMANTDTETVEIRLVKSMAPMRMLT